MTIKFTIARFRLAEAFFGPAILLSFACVLHLIEGEQPLITEFEAGAACAVFLLNLIESFRAYAQS